MEQAPIPGARTIALHIPYKNPISLGRVQCVTGRYGYLWNLQFEWIGTILTKYQPLEEDSDGKSPSLLQQLPQVCQVGGRGHTIDTYCITVNLTVKQVGWLDSEFNFDKI